VPRQPSLRETCEVMHCSRHRSHRPGAEVGHVVESLALTVTELSDGVQEVTPQRQRSERVLDEVLPKEPNCEVRQDLVLVAGASPEPRPSAHDPLRQGGEEEAVGRELWSEGE